MDFVREDIAEKKSNCVLDLVHLDAGRFAVLRGKDTGSSLGKSLKVGKLGGRDMESGRSSPVDVDGSRLA